MRKFKSSMDLRINTDSIFENLNATPLHKINLILDLDETLIHAVQTMTGNTKNVESNDSKAS